ncbi:MAG TPA: 4Fe-4S dicluster domain-containing protein [Firmicutes bacterium]|jgi:2-oxoglutarate ferredoxin oxidoreductase subunit delta|nr:4Fe-4S dicluster domain-containing protein [Bacillota bacterium]
MAAGDPGNNKEEDVAGKKEFLIKINLDFCKACGLCYSYCPTKAIGPDKEFRASVVDADKCIGCLQCENYCPDFAIEIEEIK